MLNYEGLRPLFVEKGAASYRRSQRAATIHEPLRIVRPDVQKSIGENASISWEPHHPNGVAPVIT